MSTRSRKEAQKYRSYLKTRQIESCDFCKIDKNSSQQISETKNLKIIKNIFPYSIWEMQAVEDHLLVVPKIHTDSLSDLSEHAAKEFVDTISGYEKQGYNVYARAPQNITKTVVHQHTHLIKLAGRHKRLVLTLIKPFYVRISK